MEKGRVGGVHLDQLAPVPPVDLHPNGEAGLGEFGGANLVDSALHLMEADLVVRFEGQNFAHTCRVLINEATGSI